ncbi:MAG: proprotein convertase P-domain-containing protein, partial [Candidatus Krumholzibacteria bacterium]|nr:proprotein convertase P-domain-containing protein [Candidatus Krumholzibacteria bacterium]
LLVGPWVEVFNSSQARANEPTLVYNYDPTIVEGAFQEVNVYYHINEFQEYFQNTLGIMNARARVTDTYAHQGTDDNSDYSPSQDRIRYGDGGVDDSDDGEIVLHEYGHAVHNDIVPGFVYAAETGAISEGFGDYFGATYGDNALVGEWDAVSYNPGPPPFLRRTDTTKHYPEDIVGQVHSDGEIISAAWWDFRNLVGSAIADQIIIEGMFYTGVNATFQDYADGMVAADQALYGGTHVGYIFQAFGGRGIGATYLLNFNHVALGDSEDTAGPYSVVTTISHTSPITAPDAVTLYHRIAGAAAWTPVTMTATGNFDEWAASIPGPGANVTVEYYMTVTDDSGISGAAPTTAPTDVYSFIIGPDAQFPVVAHTPVRDQPLLTWPASVDAMVTDNGAIASASVAYSLNGVSQADLTLVDMGGDMYSAMFLEAAGSLVIGDTFEYTITVVDGSSSANTTVDGPHTFMIIDALGVVLILDDDTAPKSDRKYGKDKQPLPPHIRDDILKGASATSMATILTDAGWVVVEEAAGLSDPASWSSYSFIITSSGASTGPVADAAYRSAIEAYVAGGGKVLSEGGEVGYDAISTPGYPTYASNVIHGFDWDADNAGPLVVASGMDGHPILSSPNMVAPSLSLNYSGFGDQDGFKVNPDAYIVMGTTSSATNAGIMVFDDNPNPASAQIVHYAFNFAVLADPAEAIKLLENTALFLTATEAGGTASMAGTVEVMGGSNDGVLIEASPGGYSTLTNPDGSWLIENMFGNTYPVTATVVGFGAAPQTVVLADGEARTGIDFGLSPELEFVYCDQPALSIPDSDPAGVSTQILVTDGDVLVDVTADIDLTHTWKGDLILELTSPAGTVVRLHNRSGSSTDDIVTNFDAVTAVDGPGAMSDFDGESPIGFWTLAVSDNAGGDTGVLNSWCLNVTVSDLVVASDAPVLQVNQTQGGRELSWDYNPITSEAFHVYRRTANTNAVRLTEQPLSSTDGHIAFSDNSTEFEVGTVLYYSLREVRDGGVLGFGDEIEVTVTSSLPTVFALHDNYPNPFNPITNINFDLPKAGHVSLRIYDLSGRLVRSLVDENLARSSHTYQWDGADNSGRRAASGVYYYRVQTERTSETGKMMLVK